DLDGTTEYSNQVEVQVGILKTRLRSHPNPFNPVTEVRYYLPEKTEVELILFDIMGRRVGEVIKQSEQEEGEYEIKLNSSDYRLTSGIYFLTLKTNKDRITEKIVLLR
ncbi:MAG: T9SS type A sorting domain-containing protein, partial [Ignavibacteria bacterium]|nr:T9SS type A sorting domain-containing protein [Ignavibacteria bacterium]